MLMIPACAFRWLKQDSILQIRYPNQKETVILFLSEDCTMQVLTNRVCCLSNMSDAPLT